MVIAEVRKVYTDKEVKQKSGSKKVRALIDVFVHTSDNHTYRVKPEHWHKVQRRQTLNKEWVVGEG